MRTRRRNYLLLKEYRKTSVKKFADFTESEALGYLAELRWGNLGDNKQVCPKCQVIASHYVCPSINGWKCREKLCGAQFTLFSGTRLHGTKMPAKTLLLILMQFVEAKDGVSSLQICREHDCDHQTAHVLTLKIREALRETMQAEPPLRGVVQADAAYFIKYVRPANVGMGASNAAKADQKNAGLDEKGKAKNTISPNMHALVVFVQVGSQGSRRYKAAKVKTENMVDILTLAKRFCAPETTLITDQHGAYNVLSGAFDVHHRVNHTREFVTPEGINTNLVESIFARLRASVHGAWHRMSMQNLEEYGWEICWRQTMVGFNNEDQLRDLTRRVLNFGRAKRFADYWGKRPVSERPPREEVGEIRELPKSMVKVKRGRPPKGSVRPQGKPRMASS
jgi:hypothetical protein